MKILITSEPVSILVLITSFFLALVLGLFLPFAVRPILKRWNMVDIPTERSSHTSPVFRGMGLATASAALMVFAFALVTGMIPSDRLVSLAILLSMFASCLLGWFEDLRGVSIGMRFGLQILIGLSLTVTITLLLGTAFLWIPLGVFAVAAYINVVNFMDGVNGISGLHGGLIGAFYAFAGIVNHLPWLAVGGAVLAGSFLAFLPWNIRTGRNVFLGDAGSYFLGGAIASMAVGAFLSGVYVEYILSPALIYLADTGFTLCRRIIAGEQWYKPHRTHTYQRLTDCGFSHLASAFTVTFFSLAVGVVSIMAIPRGTEQQAWSGALVIALIALYLGLPSLLKRRHAQQ